MTNRAISIPQASDPGTFGNVGFDYQKALTISRCITMLGEPKTSHVVCEFHDDMLEIQANFQKLHCVQVKQSSSKTWTLENIIKVEGKGDKGIIGKLFVKIQEFKDVEHLAIWGHGDIQKAKEGQLTLEEFIYLLETPQQSRDTTWETRFKEYQGFFINQLKAQKISEDTVIKGLACLNICLNLSSPDSIDFKNKEDLVKAIKSVFNVSLSIEEINGLYRIIVEKVVRISNKPLQHWKDKSISREELVKLLLDKLNEISPSGSREQELTTQDKLTRVGLGERRQYAFARRLDAMSLRFEHEIEEEVWEDIRTEISVKINSFRKESPLVSGVELWKELLDIFDSISSSFAENRKSGDKSLDRNFIEGVFFDMTGVCLAEWMRR